MNSRANSAKNNINTSIISCRNHIHTINNINFERDQVLKWFKILCEHLTKIITQIGKYYKDHKQEMKYFNQSGTLLLYLTQTLSTLSLLINILVREDEIKLVLTEARKCVIKQITCCLESINISISTEVSKMDVSDNFVKWVDVALTKISEIDISQNKAKIVEIFEETRQVFEEVLSHAMSIAQIALKEDGKIIRGSCQLVLHTLNSLGKEIDGGVVNGAMVNLFIDACSDKLCSLERKVNTAVLKLCMNTFSEFTKPLENIRDFCFDPSNRTKQVDDFDGLVVDFDLHVDRLMQIGLFAVSCSSDFVRGIKIRSCLASLEALESELVPTLHTVLVDNSAHNVNCATLLMQHWFNQANTLQQLIYLIIDPFAFCQIIYEEAAEIVDNLSCSVKKKNILIQRDIDNFLSLVKVLQHFLNIAQSEFTENEANKVNSKLKDLNDVIEEVDSASKILLNVEIANLESSTRVLKRCKILLTVLKRLWYCFVDDIPDKNVCQNNVTSCYMTNNERQALDLSCKQEKIPIEATGNAFLDHIVKRGKQILQDRSILYKTPIKKYATSEQKFTKSQHKTGDTKEIPLSKLVHLRKFSFTSVGSRKETSLDLQITDILNEMMNLSTSVNRLDIKREDHIKKM